MKQQKEWIEHPFLPIYDTDSQILILGSLPSVKSRENNFYYAHPQNRFWKLLYALYEEPLELEKEDRICFLHRHHIALWDVVASCRIIGSSDASISDVIPNDIEELLLKTKITTIFTTGSTAKKYYDRYCLSNTKKEAILLPSPSPANAKMKFEELLEAYQIVRVSNFDS